MTSEEFRTIALALPHTEEREHMGHPDFRVGGKVFASLLPGRVAKRGGSRSGAAAPSGRVGGDGREGVGGGVGGGGSGGRRRAARNDPPADEAMVRLPPDVQAALVGAAPDVWRPAAGAWGRQGCTLLRLADADRAAVREALEAAWHARAPGAPASGGPGGDGD